MVIFIVVQVTVVMTTTVDSTEIDFDVRLCCLTILVIQSNHVQNFYCQCLVQEKSTVLFVLNKSIFQLLLMLLKLDIVLILYIILLDSILSTEWSMSTGFSGWTARCWISTSQSNDGSTSAYCTSWTR